MALRNAGVPTTLGPIGVETTLDLMEHAFTSTVVGLTYCTASGPCGRSPATATPSSW